MFLAWTFEECTSQGKCKICKGDILPVAQPKVPPRWTEAKAATDIALTIDPQHVAALAKHFCVEG
jgi:hypothetical protein